MQTPFSEWKQHYWFGVGTFIFSIVHELFIHNNVVSIEDLEAKLVVKQGELDRLSSTASDLTAQLESKERTIKIMVKEFDSFFDEYLREVVRVVAGDDTHTRVTLYTFNASTQTFSAQNRYSRSASYRIKSPREYPVTGFLKKIWNQEGIFYKCSGNAQEWHVENGISNSDFETLKLKGRLYSGVRIDLGLQEHAILLLESEQDRCWTKKKFEEFFNTEGLTRLSLMTAAQKTSFSSPELSREIE